MINTIYTPIFHIGKILLSLNCFNSNSNRNITELVIDTIFFYEKIVNIKNNKLKLKIHKAII